MAEATLTGAERIAAAFDAARAEGRAALMPYMMAGYPDRESSLAIAAAYADSGADLIELGVPFSDPLADGPTIHAAATAALAAGATLATALEVCRVGLGAGSGRLHGLREHGAGPRRRRPSSPRRAAAAGAAGAIVPDLPLGEAEEVREAFAAAGLALVPLVAPTTPAERRAQDLRRGPGLRLRRLHGRHHRGARRAAAGPRRAGRGDQGGRRGPGRGRLRDRHAASRPRRWARSPTA